MRNNRRVSNIVHVETALMNFVKERAVERFAVK